MLLDGSSPAVCQYCKNITAFIIRGTESQLLAVMMAPDLGPSPPPPPPPQLQPPIHFTGTKTSIIPDTRPSSPVSRSTTQQLERGSNAGS